VTLLLRAAAFALGVCLSIRMIAALYAALDLWYAIGTEYPRVLRGILGWAAALAAAGWLLAPPYRTALAAGALAFLVFYLGLFVIRHPVLRALRRSQAKADAAQQNQAAE
jgi:hypothetical protein